MISVGDAYTAHDGLTVRSFRQRFDLIGGRVRNFNVIVGRNYEADEVKPVVSRSDDRAVAPHLA